MFGKRMVLIVACCTMVCVISTILYCAYGLPSLGPFAVQRKALGPVVSSLSFSDDGKLLAVTDGGHTIYVFQEDEEKPQRTLADPSGRALFATFSPTAKLLVSSDVTGVLHVWDMQNWDIRSTLKPETPTYSEVQPVFSRDGTIMVSVNEPDLLLWNMRGLAIERRISHGNTRILAVALSPGSEMVAAGCTDKSIIVWNPTNGELVRKIVGHEASVTSLSFCCVDNVLASGGADNVVRFWNARSGTGLGSLRDHKDSINRLLFRPGTGELVSGSADGSLIVWDKDKLAKVATLQGHSGGVRALAFSPNGKVLATGGMDNSVKLWDANTWKLLRSISLSSRK